MWRHRNGQPLLARRAADDSLCGGGGASVSDVSIEGSVLAANEAFYAAFNARDLDAMASLWARQSPVACVHPGWNVLTGREDVLTSWERILSNPDQARIVSGGASVNVIGSLGVVVCREFVGGTPLLATNLFVEEDGAWRMVHHHSGPVMQMG
jgi:ketosteroid isomerase-like protein